VGCCSSCTKPDDDDDLLQGRARYHPQASESLALLLAPNRCNFQQRCRTMYIARFQHTGCPLLLGDNPFIFKSCEASSPALHHTIHRTLHQCHCTAADAYARCLTRTLLPLRRWAGTHAFTTLIHCCFDLHCCFCCLAAARCQTRALLPSINGDAARLSTCEA
jgi:hypothetical protein